MESYDQRVAELDQTFRKSDEEIEGELAALEARRKAAQELDLAKIAGAGLLPDVQSALLLPDAPWMQPPPKPGILARLRAFFARIAEFFRRLFGRGRARPPKRVREDRTVTFATLAASGRALGASELGDALARLTPRERDELGDRVDRSLAAKERDLAREAEAKRKETERQRRALEEEREEARRRAERDADARVKEAEERRLARELKERGWVAEREGKLSITYGLIERFARLVLEEETRSLPGDVRMSFRGTASTGIYEKARLRQAEEVAHLDLPSSLLEARLQGSKHIDEATSFVYREVTSERVHVVLMFDKSGSMAEGSKLLAAKKALLALYIAIRRRHPDAAIDVVAFENDVRLLDLLELWECAPGSFTNTAEALRTAHLLLRSSKATRKEVYLVTDGLPEAYTEPDGRVRSGNLDAALEHAVARAQELATVTPLKFTMVLIRSDHPEYETAARLIARTLSGTLVVTDPDRLGVELLVRWAGGTETSRKAVAPPAAPGSPAPAARAKSRKRKADRRMGG